MTIDVLVADARAFDEAFSPWKIRYWTVLGLLDYPVEQPGNGHGSAKALYPASQRPLLQALVRRPPGTPTRRLAQFPVWVWMYGGDDWVPTRQARRALQTALGFRVDFRKEPGLVSGAGSSKNSAQDTARTILSLIDSPRATDTSRNKLFRLLTDIFRHARIADEEDLKHAIRNVFEPEYGPCWLIQKAIGHPAAPFTTDTLINEIRAQLRAINALKAGEVSDQDLIQARDAHWFAQAESVKWQPVLATAPPGTQMYPPITPQDTLNRCCSYLLREVGRQIMEPDVAERMRRARSGQPRPALAELGVIPHELQYGPGTGRAGGCHEADAGAG